MRINQFQHYAQKENTVTNNILLMLSRLNDLSPNNYRLLVERLNADTEMQEYLTQPSFNQQTKAGAGTIDGHIEVKASKILIETKLNQKEFIDKLLKYGDAFEPNGQNQLWHLSTVKYTKDEVTNINAELKRKYDFKIHFSNVQFSDILDELKGLAQEHPYDKELDLLCTDFEEYCYNEGLVSDKEYKLLFAPTGFSFDWNLKHEMYFCPSHWHKQPFKYFGLYNWKSVRSIATIDNVIEADYDAESKTVKVFSEGVTDQQLLRLQKGLDDWGENQSGLKYYLFKESDFYETDFRKATPGGIQGYRYKDLRQFIKEPLEGTSSIAEKLRTKEWN